MYTAHIETPPTPRPTEQDIHTLSETVKRCYTAFYEDPDDSDALHEVVCLSIGYVEISPDEDGTMTDCAWGLSFDEDGDLVDPPEWAEEVSA